MDNQARISAVASLRASSVRVAEADRIARELCGKSARGRKRLAKAELVACHLCSESERIVALLLPAFIYVSVDMFAKKGYSLPDLNGFLSEQEVKSLGLITRCVAEGYSSEYVEEDSVASTVKKCVDANPSEWVVVERSS